jgi:hypothetical protein
MAFVKNTYYAGALPENLPGLQFTSRSNLTNAINALLALTTSSSTKPSILVSDQIVASQGILTSNVFTNNLVASSSDFGVVHIDTLSVKSLDLPTFTAAVNNINELASSTGIISSKLVDLNSMVSGLASSSLNVSSLVNSLSSTTASLASTTALMNTRLLNVENKLAILATSSPSLITLEGLTVNGPTILVNGLSVSSISATSSSALISLLSDTEFIGRPYFTRDTGGTALIKKGVNSVDITFDRDYIETPVVNATPATDASTSDAVADAFFDNDIRFLITKKNTHGFTIRLNKPAPENLTFSWIALAIKNAALFTSIDATNPITPNQGQSQTQQTTNQNQNTQNQNTTVVTATSSSTPVISETSSTTTPSSSSPASTTTDVGTNSTTNSTVTPTDTNTSTQTNTTSPVNEPAPASDTTSSSPNTNTDSSSSVSTDTPVATTP